MARALDIGVTAWSPLAGVLSGKYSNIQKNADEQKRYSANNPMSASFVNERNISIATEVQVIAKEINRTPSQIALNWIRQRQHKDKDNVVLPGEYYAIQLFSFVEYCDGWLSYIVVRFK